MRISPFHEVSANLLSSRIQPRRGKLGNVNGTISPFVGDLKDLAEDYE
jgi:hypothetical protein